jgi:hypothetical protein
MDSESTGPNIDATAVWQRIERLKSWGMVRHNHFNDVIQGTTLRSREKG